MTTKNDPARSALAAFVSACGGNPPDWLREEHAAAESALAENATPKRRKATRTQRMNEQHAGLIRRVGLLDEALRRIRGVSTSSAQWVRGKVYEIATEAISAGAGAGAFDPWHALECAQFWLQEEAASEHPGQTKPDDILRVIGDALAGRPAPAAVSRRSEGCHPDRGREAGGHADLRPCRYRARARPRPGSHR